jgi:drug/metabolite transporter (DMT)-like permease
LADLIPAIGSFLSFGVNCTATKNSMNKVGRHKAIVYGYAVISLILLAGALAFRLNLIIPQRLLPLYLLEIIIGAGAVIAYYKAMDLGRASSTLALSQSYVLLVLLAGVLLLGESLSLPQIAGALIILSAAIAISIPKGGRLEGGTVFLPITIAGWATYYSLIKVFVDAMGPYSATVVLESGIFVMVSLFYLARGKDLSLPERIGWPSIGVQQVSACLGAVLYSLSVLSIGAGLTAAIGSGSLIINSVASYFWLKEKMDMRTYLAIAAMVVGLMLISL